MTKKSEISTVVKELFCQDCKTHKNNPSQCLKFDKYVGRKTKPCDDFKSK